jgi:hypothetical protein
MKRTIYPVELYEVVRTDILKPAIKKLLNEDCRLVMAKVDLKNAKVVLTDMSAKKFSDLLKDAWKDATLVEKFWHFLHYKLHIKFRADKKSLYTHMAKLEALCMLVKKGSIDERIWKSQWGLLYHIANDTNSHMPIHLSDNCGYSTDDCIEFLYSCGKSDEATKILDIWMKSKFTDQDRKKYHKAVKAKMIEMVSVN